MPFKLGTFYLAGNRNFLLGSDTNIAAALMLLHPGSIAGACLFRSKAMVNPEPLPTLEGVPVLISASQTDHLITTEDAEALATLLTNAGARVDLAIQNAGHDLTPADFSLAKQWFSKLVG